jgi:hypothetical protein
MRLSEMATEFWERCLQVRMLERLRQSVDGQLSSSLRRMASKQAPDRLHELISTAIANWETENFHAFGTDEHSYNMRLYDHMRRIKHQDAMRWALISVTLETGYPTAAQLAGNADPRQLKRPDIVARFGGVHEMHVEAKRIDDGVTLTRAYVQNGMRRFIDGEYAHDPHGTMVGYVLGSDSDAVVAAINQRILEEADLDAVDHVARTSAAGRRCVLESEHGGGICRLIHLHVQLV